MANDNQNNQKTNKFVEPFETGSLLATAGVSNAIHSGTDEGIMFRHFVADSFGKHIACNWGDLDAEDIEVNNDALKHGGRLFSAYIPKQYPQLDNEEYKIWIITESSRTSTTILFPSEY
jgi:hypothetical protein